MLDVDNPFEDTRGAALPLYRVSQMLSVLQSAAKSHLFHSLSFLSVRIHSLKVSFYSSLWLAGKQRGMRGPDARVSASMQVEFQWSALSFCFLTWKVKGGSVNLTVCDPTLHGVDSKNYPNPRNRELTGTRVTKRVPPL